MFAYSEYIHMEVIYETAALKDLRGMPKADAKRIMDALQQIADVYPQRLSFITEMQGAPSYWRARKGMWRAVYRQTDVAIEVVAINKRGEIYR